MIHAGFFIRFFFIVKTAVVVIILAPLTFCPLGSSLGMAPRPGLSEYMILSGPLVAVLFFGWYAL